MVVSITGSVRRLQNTILHSESFLITIGHINFDMKMLGKRNAGKPPVPFDVAGAGNVEKCARQFSTLRVGVGTTLLWFLLPGGRRTTNEGRRSTQSRTRPRSRLGLLKTLNKYQNSIYD